MSKRESTLKEVASSTKELRELLDQHTVAGTSLGLSDDVKVRGRSKIIQLTTTVDGLEASVALYWP